MVIKGNEYYDSTFEMGIKVNEYYDSAFEYNKGLI
jgi:hypothetical protein